MYHNHKEISAWAGLALHVLFCGFILSANTPQNHQFLAKGILTGIVLFVAIFVFSYVRNQLKLKDLAADISGAAEYLLVEIILKEDSELDPKYYMRINEENVDNKVQFGLTLPDRLLKEGDRLKEDRKAKKYQKMTRWMLYALLLLSTISVIGIKWIVALGQQVKGVPG